jgi:hypothetical protein
VSIPGNLEERKVTVSKLVKMGFNRVSGTILPIVPETTLKETVDP